MDRTPQAYMAAADELLAAVVAVLRTDAALEACGSDDEILRQVNLRGRTRTQYTTAMRRWAVKEARRIVRRKLVPNQRRL